ncbi:hypothetical protein LZ153_07020, partial [Streptococcus agalactiae]|nr:hypothetical protein [Streptococcus agalactiae]
SYLGLLDDSEKYGDYTISRKRYKSFESSLQLYILQSHRLEIWNYEPIPLITRKINSLERVT